MKTEPKACAYCGGKISAIEDCDEDGYSRDAWVFHCEDCDLETLVATADYEEAVEAFNRRAKPGPATNKVIKATAGQLIWEKTRPRYLRCVAANIGLLDDEADEFLAEQGAE